MGYPELSPRSCFDVEREGGRRARDTAEKLTLSLVYRKLTFFSLYKNRRFSYLKKNSTL